MLEEVIAGLFREAEAEGEVWMRKHANAMKEELLALTDAGKVRSVMERYDREAKEWSAALARRFGKRLEIARKEERR